MNLIDLISVGYFWLTMTLTQLRFSGEGLSSKGMLVDGYSTSHEMLESFEANMYDLAILDIMMPVLSRFELYREVKKADPAILSASFLLLKSTQMSSKKYFLL